MVGSTGRKEADANGKSFTGNAVSRLNLLRSLPHPFPSLPLSSSSTTLAILSIPGRPISGVGRLVRGAPTDIPTQGTGQCSEPRLNRENFERADGVVSIIPRSYQIDAAELDEMKLLPLSPPSLSPSRSLGRSRRDSSAFEKYGACACNRRAPIKDESMERVYRNFIRKLFRFRPPVRFYCTSRFPPFEEFWIQPLFNSR